MSFGCMCKKVGRTNKRGVIILGVERFYSVIKCEQYWLLWVHSGIRNNVRAELERFGDSRFFGQWDRLMILITQNVEDCQFGECQNRSFSPSRGSRGEGNWDFQPVTHSKMPDDDRNDNNNYNNSSSAPNQERRGECEVFKNWSADDTSGFWFEPQIWLLSSESPIKLEAWWTFSISCQIKDCHHN